MKLFKPLSCAIGLRYCFSRQKPSFISTASWSATIGIALGTAILITVLSVMNGFVDEVKNHLAKVHHHVVFRAWDKTYKTKAMQKWLALQPGVVAVEPFVQVQSLIKFDQQSIPILLESLPAKSNHLLSNISFSLVINDVLAKAHRIKKGSEVLLIGAALRTNLLGTLPAFRRFNISHIVPTHSEEGYRVWTDIGSARRLAGLEKDQITGLSVVLANPQQAAMLADHWRTRWHTKGWFSAWSDQYQAFFKSIVLQKMMMFLVLMLIIIMAVFSLISGMVMLVNNKRQEIAILKTMGWSGARIWTIFMTHGCCCSLMGMALGSTLGIFLAHHVTYLVQIIESFIGQPWLSHALYSMDHLPSKLVFNDVITINIVTFSLSLLASIYPSWQATKVSPVKTLKAGGG